VPAHRPLVLPVSDAKLRHDPARPFRSLPHSADLGAPADSPDALRLAVPGPLAWHGSARLTAEITVLEAVEEPVELVATFVHARPDGVRTRLTDASVPVPPGGGAVELEAAPTAVSLPGGHALHVELTVGRPPRRPAPSVPVELGLELRPLLLPRPEDPS
jgi:hypothetical protein